MVNVVKERAYDARFRPFFKMILAGPSGSGKTLWLYQFLKSHELIMSTPPANVILYYNTWQEVYDKMKADNMVNKFIKGYPSVSSVEELSEYSPIGGSLLIIDDQALSANKDLARIFTVTARHSSTSIIYITQNIFTKNQYSRDISLQATYLVLFKNPRDNSAIKYLASQIMPNNPAFISNVYKDSLKEPYSYLIIDLHQQTQDAIRYRTNIFPYEYPVVVYIPTGAVTL